MARVKKLVLKTRRQKRIRKVIIGFKDRPRLSVFRSNKGMYAQIIDDSEGKTILGLSSNQVALKGQDAGERKGKIAVSYILGKTIGKLAKEKGIEKIVFDRGGRLYHGRVKALAEGARDAGLIF